MKEVNRKLKTISEYYLRVIPPNYISKKESWKDKSKGEEEANRPPSQEELLELKVA